MRKWLAATIVLLLWATMLALPKAEALGCASPGPIAKEMPGSTVVFKGKALLASEDGLTIFEVDRAWKGVERSRVEIYDTGWDQYEIGADYLVLGHDKNGQLRTNLCGNTGLWSQEKENVMAGLLSIVVQPDESTNGARSVQVDHDRESQETSRILWAAGLLLLVLVVVFGAIQINRRASRHK